ncbi:hypothetical protein JYU34_018072 [Plutella xylostella]|uniref:Acyl-CoA dehydrogenase family member 9, mitochondrial n=2 Tax=Plutella xylostella TaxID=51655 RepID=A0ABQ7PZW1_PLUXY|nr:hypothetical protein JYU34_018072 [Plutella xylostella]
MNITRAICPISRSNVGQSFYRKFRFSSVNNESTGATQPKVQEEKFDFEDLKVLERTERRKPAIEPFMKSVFLSKFNRDLLAYPEVLNKEEYEATEKIVSRIDKVFSDKEKTEKDRQNVLRDTSMYAAPVNLTNGGLAMNVTERIRYLETISTDLNVAKILSEHWVGLEALKQGLKPDEYQSLLPDLTSGNNLISLCIRETISTRIAQPDFRTTASQDGKGTWRINGEKECVSHQEYKLVLCALEASRFKVFLVLPNTEGVTINQDIVTFRDTPGIPLDHITEQALATTMGMSRLDSGVLCYSALKQAITASIQYVRGRFMSGAPLADISTIRARVSAAMLCLYAGESVAYFTAGLLDQHAGQDADVEVAMCRNYSSYHGTRALLALESIPGLQLDEQFRARLGAFRALTRDENDYNVDMFIALNGLHYAGHLKATEVKQMRNPLLHPGVILKKVLQDRHQEKDDPKLTLFLAEHLHPSLRAPAELLEYCVLRMSYASETLMARHGQEAQTAYTELERMAQAATLILAMTSVLARASRSYCIGLRNAEFEMKLAACFVEKTKPIVQKLILDVNNGQYLNLDFYHEEFGRKILDSSSTLVENPTERTFW